MKRPAAAGDGVVDVEALYLAGPGEAPRPGPCEVVREDALTLDVDGIGYYTLMWTPTADDGPGGFTLEDGVLGDAERPEGLCLAMGFALTEGLISGLADIASLSLCPDSPGVVRVRLRDPGRVRVHRANVVVNSSCGICGPREILQDNALALPRLPDTLRVDQRRFGELMAGMRERQAIFSRTGGSHGAAIFDRDGAIVAVAEDLGRHNALDKVIGKVLLERGDLSDCGAILSSRLSLEMVLKAVRAGLQVVLAISAPTSLAIEVAERFGVTLCGFVREPRATVFSHPQRIV